MVKQLGVMMMAVCAAVAVYADIAFEVKDVEAHQRYPWNGKVDIDFTIDSAVEGSNFTVSVSAEDTVGKTNVVLSSVRYDDKIPLSRLGKIAAGRHRLTWDGDADVPDTLIPSLAFSVSAWAGETAFPDPELYMVVELSGGMSAGQYPVSYLPSVPKGGWTDEYKTTKLVLRKIPGKQFYAGVFEITQKQWELVMGGKPIANLRFSNVYYNISESCVVYDSAFDCNGLGDLFPVFVLPADACEFMKRMPGQFRLPTRDEWFFVCDSNAKLFYQRMLNQGMAGWTKENSNGEAHPVGMKRPNAWGIYDMYGNISEIVTQVANGGTKNAHFVGGGFYSQADCCRECLGRISHGKIVQSCPFYDSYSSDVYNYCQSNYEGGVGFRVFCYMP